MPNIFKLACLPVENQYQILQYLTPSEIARCRAVSRNTRRTVSTNFVWKPLFRQLIKQKAGLYHLQLFPLSSWSLDKFEEGWFKAYCALHEVARRPWRVVDDEIQGRRWAVIFKLQCDPHLDVHAVVEFLPDGETKPMEGFMDLYSVTYSVANGIVRVPGYPPLVQDRQSLSWARVMEHMSVRILALAPEFLERLFDLNSELIDTDDDLSDEEKQRLRATAIEARQAVCQQIQIETENDAIHEQLKLLNVTQSVQDPDSDQATGTDLEGPMGDEYGTEYGDDSDDSDGHNHGEDDYSGSGSSWATTQQHHQPQ